MPAQHSPAVLAFAWLDIIAGAAGCLFIVGVFAWGLHGKYFVPNFGDGNLAAVFLVYFCILLFPSPIVLGAGIGLLKGKPWAWQLSLVLFPLLLALSILVKLLRHPVAIIIYAAMSILSAVILTRPGVRALFS